jgi:TPR repeat protein
MTFSWRRSLPALSVAAGFMMSAHAYQLLGHRFNATPTSYENYDLIKCDSGLILKVDPNANEFEACKEGPYAQRQVTPAIGKAPRQVQPATTRPSREAPDSPNTVATTVPCPSESDWRIECIRTLENAGRDKEAFALAKQGAAAGDQDAEYALARYFRFGIGTKPDCSQALVWLTKLAEHAYKKAQNDLATMHHDGHGLQRNDADNFGCIAFD